MEENYIKLFKISMPILKAHPINNNTLHNAYSFVVKGLSTNTLST
jgi:hypothetical protein